MMTKVSFLKALCWVLLGAWLVLGAAHAFHFPWDQGHDTFNWNNPPPLEEDQPTEEDNQTCGPTDPVNLKTGEFFYADTYHDIAVSNLGPDLSLSFTYQNRDRYSGPFGDGWHTPLTEIAVLTDDGADLYIVCRKGTGQRKRFTRNADGSFEPPAGLFASVSVQSDNSVQVTDKLGTIKTYDTGGRLVSITDRNGNMLNITYDNDGVISQATGAGGRVMTFTRGADGRIASVTDPAGRVYEFAYDANGNLTSVTDPEGKVTQYAYDAKDNLTAITDTRGNVQVTNFYDSEDRVIQQTYADGSSLQISYQSDNTTRVTNERFLVSTYGFNENGNPTTTTDPLGRSMAMEWNDDFLVTRLVDARGVESLLSYDESGNIVRHTEAVGTQAERTIMMEYDPIYGQPTKIIDGDGGITLYEYDASGNLTKITDPMGGSQTIRYDSRGLVISITDENGDTTAMAYDAFGNLVQRTDPIGHQTVMSYDAVGNLISVTEGVGSSAERTQTFEYNGRNRLISISDFEGNISTKDYDFNANLTKTVDPTGVILTRTYDQRDRLTAIDNPQIGKISFSYNAEGHLSGVLDALGGTTDRSHDASGQIIAYSDELGFTTYYTYDGSGNIVKVVGPDGGETAFTYDALNRRTSRTDPLGQVHTYSYDNRDNLVQEVDANGEGVRYEYDSLSRLIRITTSDDVRSFEYDPIGRLVSASDTDSVVTFSYDALGKVVGTVTGGSIQPQVALSYAYDSVGRRVRMSASGVGDYVYTYDKSDRLVGIQTPTDETLRMSYDQSGRLQELHYPNGIVAQHTHDPAGRLSSIKHSVNGNDVLRILYERNALGNLSSMTVNEEPTHVYGYDAAKQLTSSGNMETYVYDASGNRVSSHLSSVYAYDASNRLIRDDVFDYSYDSRGNLISRTNRTIGSIITYEYDSFNQLVRVNFPDGSTSQYAYDALGRRISVTRNGETIIYIYDGENILLEFDGAGSLKATFTHGDGIEGPLLMRWNGSTYSYHMDHQGSVRRITDQSANVVNSYDYESFGIISSRQESISNPFAFTGREYDSETGWYYFQARFLDPTLGRFTQADPAREFDYLSAGRYVNDYVYVLNNPLNILDASGQNTGAVLVGGVWVAVQTCIRSPACVRAVIAAGAKAVEALLKAAAAVGVAKAAADAIAREQEYQKYKDWCDKRGPVNPGRNAGKDAWCSFLSQAISHAERCSQLREAWDAKWKPGHHAPDIAAWRQRVQTLKNLHKKDCAQPEICEIPEG